MNVNIHESWKKHLAPEFEKPYFTALANFVKNEYSQHTCYPKGNRIFAAFDHTHFNDVKVVIIGQDPYHGMNQATGLCFGIPTEQSIPPSLRNIMKELKEDLQISLPETAVTLDHWANQGVLMLNTALTVRQGTASSHMKYWLPFTKYIFKYLSNNCPNLVYLVWGAFAHRQVEEIVDWTQNKAVISSHPSPLSAYKPYKTFPPFLGSKPFSKVNLLLEKKVKWA